MEKPRQVEVEAKTVKEAIKKALDILGAEKEDVEIKVLSEGERGLFNMNGAKLTKVRATVKPPPQS